SSANWAQSSGGAGGIGVPTLLDTAIFDVGGTNSAVIDTNIEIANIKLNSGYTGAVTQATTSVITVTGTTTVNAGTLTLAGTNNISGDILLNAGKLNINSAQALGTSVLTIAGGTIDNTSSLPVALSTNNLQNWNNSFAFGGTEDLNLGTGTITLGTTTVTINTSGTKTLVEGGVISGAYSLVKAGTGALSLNGANTYSGGTTLNAGTLNINNSGALGLGLFSETGGALKVYGNNTIGVGSTITSGTVDFYDNSNLNANMSVANGYTVDFNDLSYNKGVVVGNAKFAYATSGTATISGVMAYGTVTGTVKDGDNVSIRNWIFNDNSYNNSTTTIASSSTMKFYGGSYNDGDLTVSSGGELDFYATSTNESNIFVAEGGVVNFYESSKNNNGIITVASGGAVNFYDNSSNVDGLVNVASGGILDFYESSFNDGVVNGNVVFHDDISHNDGIINGSTTRQYDNNATTSKDFTSDGGINNWIIVAKGVIVNIVDATYSLLTNIFKAFANGFFIFGNNSAGGPVVPQISIASPLVGTSTIKWAPSIDFGVNASGTCQYKIDSGDYQTIDCSKNGSDILRPTAEEHTLYIKVTDVKGNLSEKSIVFNYDNTVPIYTSCGTDLLDEATRPYYYLAENINNDCFVNTDVELRGAYATDTPSFTLTGRVISNATSTDAFDIILKNIVVTGTTTATTTAEGKDGGNIIVENSIVGALISDGAEGAVGGKAGDITVATSTTGTIVANGGSGTSQGSNGGTVSVWNSDGLLAGTLVESIGGSATVCGSGGEGGDIQILNSNNYVAISDSGADQIQTGYGKCEVLGKQSSYIRKTPIVVLRPVPPSTSTDTNTNTNQAGGTIRKTFVQNTINQITLPVQMLKPVKLTTLPKFGEDKKGAFSFQLPLKLFLFANE
ncbi:MAG: autotransporter-associated beta strand repeat-containing protein, partial [bacterium]